MRGNWEDFAEKFGFNDGDGTEGRDYRARDILVGLLNEQPEMKTAKVRAVAYDRPGVHNGCMILIAEGIEGESDEEFLRSVQLGTAPETLLPEMEADLDDLIGEAYDAAEDEND